MSIVSFATIIRCSHTVVLCDKLCDKCGMMHFIFSWKYLLDNRDSRPHNTCMSSDK